MTIAEILPLVSVLISLLAVLLSLKSSKRTDTKDIETRVAENTRLNIKLDSIAQDVAETKEEIKMQRREVQNLTERMAKVEASARQAHLRLDRMEKVNDQERERERQVIQHEQN